MQCQGFEGQKELGMAWNPLALIQAQAASGDQVMDVGMENESARPGVEDPEHAQFCTQALGIGRQVLQSLRAGVKEQVVTDLRVGAYPGAQRIGYGESDQKIGDRQQQALALLFQPLIGIARPAERTMPVVARMIAVVEMGTVRAAEQLAAQSRSAAAQKA